MKRYKNLKYLKKESYMKDSKILRNNFHYDINNFDIKCKKKTNFFLLNIVHTSFWTM